MARGFGQRYWVQVVYQDDRPDHWEPVNGGRSLARDAAALWLAQLDVDFVLVLDGRVPKGGTPSKRQMLDEFNRIEDDRAADCKVYKLKTKAAKRVGRLGT